MPTAAGPLGPGTAALRDVQASALFTAVRTDQPLPADADGSTALTPAQLRVDVLNGTERSGLAATVAENLGSLGYAVGQIGTAEQVTGQTLIRFSPDQAAAAALLATTVPSASLGARPGHDRGAAAGARRLVRRRAAPAGGRRNPARRAPAIGMRLIWSTRVHQRFTGGPGRKREVPHYPRLMRDAYQEQLDELADGLADMCGQVADALDKATRALLECDLQLAEEVISEDIRIDDVRDAAEAKAFALLALQAPVATDLRIVVSAIHGAGDIERMGDLALHVAQAARRRHPNPVLPDEVAPYFAEMGRVGVALARKAGEVIRTRDLAAAAQLESDDDAMDDLHRHMFTVLMNRDWTHGVAPAVDVTLLARFYERYADHAVVVARRIVYVVTGRMPGPLTV